MGNEGSVPVSYDRRLLNDVKIDWIKVDGNQFASRDGHCSSSVEGRLFVFGGVRWDEAIGEVSESNETLIFDNSTQTWSMASATGSVPSARSAATMASVGTNVYVFGGLSRESGWLNDMYVLDTATLQWSTVKGVGNCPSPRDKLRSVTVGSKIYFFGGFGPTESSESEEAEFQWFNDLHTFDTETCMWKKLSPSTDGAPSPRAAHCLCVIDNNLVVFGGRDSVSRRHDIYILDLDNLTWKSFTTAGRQPEPRSFHACCSVGKRMVVFGGRGMEEQHFNDLHIFDLDTKEWLQPSVNGDVPLPRGLHTLSVVDGNIVLYGGSSDFDKASMQLQHYHNDTFVIKTEQCLKGKSLGPDPNDHPETIITPGCAETGLGTIQENEEHNKGLRENLSTDVLDNALH